MTPSRIAQRLVGERTLCWPRAWFPLILLAAVGLVGETTLPRCPAGGKKPPKLSPLDKLDPAKIPPEERLAGMPKETVAILGTNRGAIWAWSGRANNMLLSPDGRWLIGGSGDVIQVWDAATLQEVTRLPGHKSVVTMAIAPNGKRLAARTAEKGDIKLWNLTGKQPWPSVTIPGDLLVGLVTSLTLSPDGNTLAAGSLSGTIRLFDLGGDKPQASVLRKGTEQAAYTRVVFSPDGKTLAEWSSGQPMRFWDLSDKKPQERTALPGFSGFSSESRGNFVFSPDGKTLALVANGKAELWDIGSGKPQKGGVLEVAKEAVLRVEFGPDGKTLATLHDPAVRLWNLNTTPPTEVAAAPLGKDDNSSGYHWIFWKGKELTWVGYQGNKLNLRVWDFAGGQFKPRLALVGKQDVMSSLTFAPDGKTLAVLYYDAVELWDLGVGSPKKRARLYRGENPANIDGVIFTPDSKTLVVVGKLNIFSNDVRNVELWDLTVEQPKVRFRIKEGRGDGYSDKVRAALSPDGKTLVLGFRGLRAERAKGDNLKFWNLDGAEPTRKTSFELETYAPILEYTPDGKLLAVSGLYGTLLVDLKGPKPKPGVPFIIQDKGGQGEPRSLAFTPDGKLLVLADYNKVWLLDVSGSELKFRGLLAEQPFDRNTPISVTLAPDGKRVATADRNGRVVLWDTVTAKSVREWQLPGPVRNLAFAPDGRHLATANGNGTVYILRLTP